MRRFALCALAVGVATSVSAQTPAAPRAPAAPAIMPHTAIHHPEFVTAAEATFLEPDDIVLGVVNAGPGRSASGRHGSGANTVAKAYPAADVGQHGAVSDRMPDGAISVTWCGICNTGLVFHAEVKGRTLHFEYDRLVAANEIQKDIETGSSWQQATGEAIDGPLKGTRLKLYPSVRTTWAEWRRRYPQTLVLKPLPGYLERLPVLNERIKRNTRIAPDGPPTGALAVDARLPARETVAGLEIGRDTVAYPFSALRTARVVNDRVGGQAVVIVHQPSSDTTTAFESRAKGRTLTFAPANDDAGALIDRETRSTWNAYGLSVDGPLKGTQLKSINLVPQFWFAWSQFRPGTRVFAARQ